MLIESKIMQEKREISSYAELVEAAPGAAIEFTKLLQIFISLFLITVITQGMATRVPAIAFWILVGLTIAIVLLTISQLRITHKTIANSPVRYKRSPLISLTFLLCAVATVTLNEVIQFFS